MQNITAIIPARYASTRFPGKPLVDIQGKTMLQRVFEQVAKASSIHQIYVATDDERIFNHVINFGGNVILTDANHISGTDRCAEVSKQLNTDIIINVQGDEPFIQPQQIDDLANMMLNTKAQIGTQIKQITKAEMLFNTNVVKVVCKHDATAIYFSRNPIPFVRNESQDNWLHTTKYYKHIGIYAFQKATLLAITQLPASNLEKAESLEQLRWLEHGYTIQTQITTFENIGIDKPEDLTKIHLT